MPKHRPKHGGDRKHGRMAKSPAHKRYNASRRWETNKERRIAKEVKRQVRLTARKKMLDSMCQTPTG